MTLALLIIMLGCSIPLLAQKSSSEELKRIENIDKHDLVDYLIYRKMSPENLSRESFSQLLEDYISTKLVKKIMNEKDTLLYNKVYDQAEGFKDSLISMAMDYDRVTESDIIAAYKSMNTMRKVSHIQINLPDFPYPGDTLLAYEKINSLYKKLVQGEDFQSIALQYSENPLTSADSGYIGYVTLGTLTYPMELESYSTPVDEFSRPVMTFQGYHIMMVHEEIPSPGKIGVSHIIKYIHSEATSAEVARITSELDSIRQIILSGRDFDDVAKSFSDDKKTRNSGGFLGYFTPDARNPELSQALMAMEEDGDISPVLHIGESVSILKRTDIQPIPALDQIRDSIRDVLGRNRARTEFLKKLFYDRVKKKINFIADPEAVQDFIYLGKNNFEHGYWHMPEKNRVLFSLDSVDYTFWDLSHIMQEKRYAHRVRNYRPVVWKSYSSYEEMIIDNYIRNNPEEVFPELMRISRLHKGELLKNAYIKANVLPELTYKTQTLKRFYRSNKHRYTLRDNPNQFLSFENAFTGVLRDYQYEAEKEWQKQFLKDKGIKIPKTAAKKLLRSLQNEIH